jgi:hypothetical protein
MIGLAASPGTAVEPTCSACRAVPRRTARIRAASRSNSAGHCGSYSANVIGALCGMTFPMYTTWSSSSVVSRGSYSLSACHAAGAPSAVGQPGNVSGFREGRLRSHARGCRPTRAWAKAEAVLAHVIRLQISASALACGY